MAESRASARSPAVVQRKPAAVAARATAAAVGARAVPAARNLQSRIGSSGAQVLAARAAANSASTTVPLIQTSLTVSQPGDPYEKEADRVADAVMRMPASPSPTVPAISTVPSRQTSLQRACAECGHEMEEKHVQREQAGDSAPRVTPSVEANVNTLQGEGSPLPKATRDFFEPRMGADFSQVRVNNGARANETANALGARAFTVGQSISFASGQYAPASHEGQKLLAHELTHVVQQDSGVRRATVQRKEAEPQNAVATTPATIVHSTSAPRLQPAWYNFDIPFTDYQFDPSFEGLKTAAGVVKDTAIEALDWIVDQVRDLVNSGLDWLRDQWKKLQDLAESAWNSAKKSLTDIVKFLTSPLGFLVDAVMKLDADSITRAWNKFSAIVNSVANGFKAVVDKLLGGINKVWGFINSSVTSLLNRLAGITSNWLFKKLPEALQNVANGLINTLKSLWKSISDGFTTLITKVNEWVNGALDIVFGFVRKVLAFGINVVIKGIVQFGQLVLFMKDLFTNPMKYVRIMAEKSVKAFDGVKSRFAGVVGQYFSGARAPAAVTVTAEKGAASDTKVHRAPVEKGAAEPKTSASWSDIGSGVWKVMGDKWDQFLANPMAVVLGLLRDLVFPMIGNIEDIINLFKGIYHIVTGPLSAGSLDEFWTSLLKILDIPILIYHTVVSILMRSLMVPLIVASFIPHPLVKGIAAAVGYGLLGMFVESELLNIGHKLVLLKTGKTTDNEKKEAYNRIADSLIAFAMALAIFLFMLLLHFLANVAKGIYSFVKGKVFGIEPVPVESKGGGTGEGKGSKGGPEEGKGDGKPTEAKAGEGTPSKDGKRKIRMNEEGKCEVCASPCEKLRKKYGSLVTSEIEGKIKAIEDNPKLDNAAKEEALKPIEQELADALQAKAASVKGPYSHLVDDVKVEPGRQFTSDTQKPKILAENAKKNGGKLMSDEPLDPWFGKELEPPLKGKQEPGNFAKVPGNQAQVDHIVPRIGPDGKPLGSNSYSNARVTSADFNRGKSNKL